VADQLAAELIAFWRSPGVPPACPFQRKNAVNRGSWRSLVGHAKSASDQDLWPEPGGERI
jgi:hypothetical protein